VSLKRAVWATYLALLTLAAPMVCAAEDHAGKPILRDTTFPPPSQAPAPPTAFDLDSGRVALALITVVGLIFLLRYIGRTFFPAATASGRGQIVKVLARCTLSPRQHVLLIQIGRRIVVAADCGAQLSSLCQITDADEVAALLGEIQQQKSSPASKFTSWFARATEEFTDEHDLPQPLPENSTAVENDNLGDSREIAGLTRRVRDLARQLGGPGQAA
jgi:flagellar biogenesis protein FliO